MPRTRAQLDRAAADAARWLESLDPATTPADDTSDLRDVALAVRDVAAAEQRLAASVAAARAHGRSWGRIAAVLGVSKQAVASRFGAPAVEGRVVSRERRRTAGAHVEKAERGGAAKAGSSRGGVRVARRAATPADPTTQRTPTRSRG